MDIILLALATWRIGSIVAIEHGPMWIFSNFRAWLDKQTSPVLLSFKEGIECIWCNSVWVAAVMALFADGNYVVNVFAISAVAILIDSLIGKLNG